MSIVAKVILCLIAALALLEIVATLALVGIPLWKEKRRGERREKDQR